MSPTQPAPQLSGRLTRPNVNIDDVSSNEMESERDPGFRSKELYDAADTGTGIKLTLIVS